MNQKTIHKMNSLILALGVAMACSGSPSSAGVNSPVTVTDLSVSEGKWSASDKGGLTVIEGTGPVVSNINLAATIKDPATGTFSASVHNLKKGAAYEIALYSPYKSGYEDVSADGISVSIPVRQNGATSPIRFGRTSYSGGSKDVRMAIEECSAELVIRLSTSSGLFAGWSLTDVSVYAENGAALAGDAIIDLANGTLRADASGEKYNYVACHLPSPFVIGSEEQSVPITIIPEELAHQPVRIEYKIEKDGEQKTICHSYRLFNQNIRKGDHLTLYEKIPAALSGDWYDSRFPGVDWTYAEPESVGFSSDKLENLRKYIADNLSTTSMMVIVDGKVIFTLGDITDTVRIASCRKSLLSMMYGKYVENGTIDLDATLEDLGIDEDPSSLGGVLLPIEKKAKVRHLITARSGVYHMPSNDGDDHAYAPERGSKEPGTYFLYNNWDFNCAGAVLEQLVGKNIYEIFRDDIAIPIGLQDYEVSGQRKWGNLSYSKFPAYHFWLSTRDMARIAYLMLNKGNWNGNQVVSEDWVKTTTSIVTPRADMHPDSRLTKEFDYGYLWWLFCKEFSGYDPAVYADGYTATGLGGQYFTVLPALNMVIAHKDETGKMGKSTYYKLIARVAACKQ